MKVLITGASGQLGQAFQFIEGDYKDVFFTFTDSHNGDITDKKATENLLNAIKPDFCINAAAYTAVDKAEAEQDTARLINVEGPDNLAAACKKHGATLIHISTDFVFDGSKKDPYTEDDTTNPQSVYGLTKQDGELKIQEQLNEYYIIRTSWVYSDFGNNFMKTMLRVAKEQPSLNVVDDQTGTPTHAVDLARAIMHIITSGTKAYGIYNFSNEGETTWYGFAKKIFEVNNVNVEINPISTTQYPTPAKRPEYSVLDKSKIKKVFGIQIRNWEEALNHYKQ
jgi:dTDP-4-dehydrorhamnose reductase